MATLAPFGFQAGQSRRSVNEYYVPASDTSAYAVGDVVRTNGNVFTGRLPDSRVSAGMLHVAKAAPGVAVRGVIVGVAAGPGDNSAQSIPATKTRAYTLLVNDRPETLWDIQANNTAQLSVMAGTYASYTVGGPLGSVSSTVVDADSIGTTVSDLLIAEVLSNTGANSLLRVAFVQHEMAAAGGSPQIGAQIQSLASGAGIGGSTITRAALIALAEADGLTPGALYLTTDGLQCQALTARFLQPIGPWFVDGRPWSVGSATTAIDLSYTYLPPLAPNTAVELWAQWEYDAGLVAKRTRFYLEGTLGAGVAGAQDIDVRNLSHATNKSANQYLRFQNRNDSASQIALTDGNGDPAAFGLTSGAWNAFAVSTNTSKLLRVMGETSKSGSNVAFTATRTGTTANATSVGHGLATGDYIGVTGATGTGAAQYNADPVQVTVETADTFTYTMASDPGASASGSPVFQKYLKLVLVSFRVDIHQGLGF